MVVDNWLVMQGRIYSLLFDKTGSKNKTKWKQKTGHGLLLLRRENNWSFFSSIAWRMNT
jgi:hypothetical protein